MILPNIKLLALLLATSVCTLTCLLTKEVAATAVCGFALVLVIPGMLVVKTLNRDHAQVEGQSSAFWAIGSSMVIAVLGGLFLNVISGLNHSSWVAYLCGISGVLLVVGGIQALLERRRRSTQHLPDKKAVSAIQIAVAVVAVISLGYLVIGSDHRSSNLIAANTLGRGPFPRDAIGKCPKVDVSATINFVSKRDALGYYGVLALGSVVNHSSVDVKNVVVTWVVQYADLSTGSPTRTTITGWQISRQGHGAWGGTAAENDGQVPPTGVHVIKVTGAPAGIICTNSGT